MVSVRFKSPRCPAPTCVASSSTSGLVTLSASDAEDRRPDQYLCIVVAVCRRPHRRPDRRAEPLNNDLLALPADYADWLASLKQRIRGARQRALLAVNEEQIRLYHEIGRETLERQTRQGWGAKVIDRVASDLRVAFPDMKGLSSRNLKYMKAFAQHCPDFLIGQQSAAQLPWFHIVTLITKLPDANLRDWYAREALAQSWARDTLTIQIKSQLHLRQGAAVTNFEQRLPAQPAQHRGDRSRILWRSRSGGAGMSFPEAYEVQGPRHRWIRRGSATWNVARLAKERT
jgi:predicted nuclease of restriction endonuclease-like (RecB) superfamily